MTLPLALIGPAIVEVIGINPTGFGANMEATFARHQVFGSELFIQPVGGGENVETLNLACRPHVHGGLENYSILQGLCRARLPVPYLRMSGLVGINNGLVVIQRIGRDENAIAPTGIGRRWEFTVELLHVGNATGVGL